MKNLAKLFLSLCLPFCCFTSPLLAQGEITVEYKNGDTEVFYDVEISDTKDIIYFQVKRVRALERLLSLDVICFFIYSLIFSSRFN